MRANTRFCAILPYAITMFYFTPKASKEAQWMDLQYFLKVCYKITVFLELLGCQKVDYFWVMKYFRIIDVNRTEMLILMAKQKWKYSCQLTTGCSWLNFLSWLNLLRESLRKRKNAWDDKSCLKNEIIMFIAWIYPLH